ncbi:hypothetical protein M1D88_11205 [Arthrobacter sp. R1-13]
MSSPMEPVFPERSLSDRDFPERRFPGREPDPSGVLKAMSPGVVDFLFRRLVAGESSEDVQWNREGMALAAQPVGAELARRLAETDVEALTPTELFHYVRAAQRLAAWAESLKEEAVQRYCGGPDSRDDVPLHEGRDAGAGNSGRRRGRST